jgi:hypothetical protein
MLCPALQDPESPVQEAHALELFGLQQCECLYEPSTDTKGLIAWGGSGIILLAFRGTASMQNVLTDIKASGGGRASNSQMLPGGAGSAGSRTKYMRFCCGQHNRLVCKADSRRAGAA